MSGEEVEYFASYGKVLVRKTSVLGEPHKAMWEVKDFTSYTTPTGAHELAQEMAQELNVAYKSGLINGALSKD